MAIPQNTLIGKTRKSIGNVEFSSWKGINVMKSKPTTVANPRTDRQQMQRSAHSQSVAIARQIPAVLKLGFSQLAVGMSGYNAFISQNLKFAFEFSAPPSATLIPANILVAKGTIATTQMTQTQVEVGNVKAIVRWNPLLLSTGQSANDKVSLAVYDATNDKWYSGTQLALRSAGVAEVDVPSNFQAGTTIFTYTFFTSADGKKNSTSVVVETDL